MMMRWKLAAILAALSGAAPALAQTTESLDLQQSYSGVSAVDVAHILTYNSYANGPGTTNSFAFSAGAFSFTDPFLKSSANPPLRTFFLGVSPETPDVSESLTSAVIAADQHLVLALGSAFAAGLVSGGQDFNTIFTGYDENTLINELELIDTADLPQTDPGYSAQQAAKQAAYGDLFSFGGSVDNRLGTTPAFGGPLTLLSFSSATPVGSGVATITPLVTPGAVPEPASWALMIGGFGLAGAAMRRRSIKVRFGTAACA